MFQVPIESQSLDPSFLLAWACIHKVSQSRSADLGGRSAALGGGVLIYEVGVLI